MRLPERNRPRFEELAEERRRVNEEYDFLVHQLEASDVPDLDRMRLEVQHLRRRHDGILEEMLMLLAE